MKALFSIFLFACLVQATYGQTDKIKTAEIKTEIWCDHCNKCESCGQNIYNKIKENKGVRNVKVESGKNIIQVKYNSEITTIEEIEDAISMAGYRANQKKANTNAYNALDDCCKKK